MKRELKCSSGIEEVLLDLMYPRIVQNEKWELDEDIVLLI